MPAADEQLSRELFLATITPLQSQLNELVIHQKQMNNRMNRAETRIAVLHDRSPNRVGIVAGSTVAAVAAGVAAVVKLLSMLP
jgi:hypothetical protein|tara:strand:- start:215 stop:463 length:249 start_codon:yes stop_codon:yes gene_type:complete